MHTRTAATATAAVPPASVTTEGRRLQLTKTRRAQSGTVPIPHQDGRRLARNARDHSRYSQWPETILGTFTREYLASSTRRADVTG